MGKRVILLAVLVLFWSVSAVFAGPYVSGNFGAVWVHDSDLSIDGDDTDADLTFDAGYGATVAVGYAQVLGKSGVRSVENFVYRGEIELGYRENDMDEIEVSDVGSVSVDGDVSTFSLMANGYVDFVPQETVSPFIGVGLGYANVEGDIDTLDIGSEDDNVFAYQFIAGVGFAVSEQVKLDVQYRFFGTEEPDFDGLEAEYRTHNAMIGLRYSF